MATLLCKAAGRVMVDVVSQPHRAVQTRVLPCQGVEHCDMVHECGKQSDLRLRGVH